ncbi:MAG TPA: hypothetical protein VK846_10780 [Candidatus Limnocylindria bacterium]|nr:hypothetical protein [Candidatus Limnocylindria bacterium]
MNTICALIITLLASAFQATTAPRFVLSCSPTNDLFRVLKNSEASCARAATPIEAVNRAAKGGTVLLLADGYPAHRVSIDQAVLAVADARNLRVYLEYPETIPGLVSFSNAPRAAVWERGVVAADHFGNELPPLSILALHECYFLPVKVEKPWLVAGRVAGFDRAVYGLPTNSFPLLFEIPERRIIVATTKLSGFVTARYAPSAHWLLIWETILSRLSPDSPPLTLKATPLVAPAYGPSEKLPRNIEQRTFNGAANWLLNSRLLVPPSRTNEIYAALKRNRESLPLPSAKIATGDGSLGILEGYSSGVAHTGDQLQRTPLRADCHAESAAVLALSQLLENNKRAGRIANNLLDYVYFHSDMCQGPRADEKHGAFGLIGWGGISPTWLVANYGDDNGRAILGTIATAAALKTDKWDEVLAKAMIGNFRTTGKLGFRGDRIDNPDLAKGWKSFYAAAPVNYSPPFEAVMWACYLWTYRATGHEPFFQRTTNAITMTMNVYPDGWRWKDNMERARMLLCLAWLVRLEDTPQHREWLRTVAYDLLQRQEPNGAIREWLGTTGGGHYQIPKSNEAYGTAETPLIQQNGDPASDQLYTTGFALLGLHEAAAVTGDAKLKRAADKLAEFLCRIQIRSKEKSYLNGWWFRAFDDRRWEYWASSADMGWGAWSVEAGWGQSWTAVTLALRQKKTTFWELTEPVRIREEFDRWKPKMLE